MQVDYHNPADFPHNPAFTPAVSVTGLARTICVGGQNAVSADGSVVGDAVGEQTERALANLESVLTDAGAGLDNIVSWSVSLVAGEPSPDAFAAFRRVWGERSRPPAVSVAIVVGLANPRFPAAVSAIAVVEGEE